MYYFVTPFYSQQNVLSNSLFSVPVAAHLSEMGIAVNLMENTGTRVADEGTRTIQIIHQSSTPLLLHRVLILVAFLSIHPLKLMHQLHIRPQLRNRQSHLHQPGHLHQPFPSLTALMVATQLALIVGCKVRLER
jgi:hypothetical protein